MTRRNLYILNAFVWGALAVIIYAASLLGGAAPQTASASDDVYRNRAETDGQLATLAYDAVVGARVHVPRVTGLFLEPTSPFGIKLHAVCGPTPGKFYPQLNYIVYPEQGTVRLCKPWGAFTDGCSGV